MAFLDHIRELRRRIIRIVLVILAATGAALVFTPRILLLLIQPYGELLKVIGPTEGVANYLRIALTCGVGGATPWIVFEIWGFIAPALLRREKRFALAIIPSALLLFLGGVAFAWFLLIPAAVKFLAGFSPEVFTTEWTSQNYIPFVTSLLFWIGVTFEMPVLVFLLARLGILSARLLLKGWRIALVLITVGAALITPTVDPFNMMLVAVPMAALYFVSILLAAIARRKPRASRAPQTSDRR
jgi:sec-independent protein translocase protein TatC